MYKLLTIEEKLKVEAEYQSRRARAALTLASLLLVFALVVFSPALILSLGKKNAAIVELSGARAATDTSEAESLSSWAQGLRTELAALSPAASSSAPYEYFTDMLQLKPATIRITSLSYSKAGNSMIAKGKAPDRDTLLRFQSSLVASGEFTKVDFPVNNLAKDSNIDFQLNLMPKL
ncbi:hypothetical protein KW800_00795 [Candidatus Parcubacteria bacterium]|nr:hypothetical protein [Candidatus Parcubacteria bacterium]